MRSLAGVAESRNSYLNNYSLRYFLSLKWTLMRTSAPHMRSIPQLCDLERFFFSEISLPEQKVTPIQLPFYNFVCYAIDMLNSFAKSPLDITFNVFLVDEHLRRWPNGVQMYRRFVGFLNSWKKFAQTDEGKLLASFLQKGRNQKQSVKLFLKFRKVLLKNINQKILQQIQLTHQDVVTIIHTLDMLTGNQRKTLTKRLNEHFIAKNVKYLNTVIGRMNAAVFCEHLMAEINDRQKENQKDSLENSLNSKINKILDKRPDWVQSVAEEDAVSSGSVNYLESSPEFNNYNSNSSLDSKRSVEPGHDIEQRQSLVNLQKCMKELYILKQKDLQIDNRFRKLNKSREQFE